MGFTLIWLHGFSRASENKLSLVPRFLCAYLNPQQERFPGAGTLKINQVMFCSQCGRNIETSARFCPQCGADLSGNTYAGANDRRVVDVQPAVRASRRSYREKSIALILGLLLGCWGAHRFYLGEKSSAASMLGIGLAGLFFLFPLLVTGIWSLVDIIRILCMDSEEFDARYNSAVR